MELEGIILPYNIQNNYIPCFQNHQTTTRNQIPSNYTKKSEEISLAFFLPKMWTRCQETSTLWASPGDFCAGRGDGTQQKIGTKKPTGENEPRTQKIWMFRYPKLEKNSLFAPENRWLENSNTAAFWFIWHVFGGFCC